MNTEILRLDHPIALNHTIDVLHNGGMVALPTDTVYGLAVSLTNQETVERLSTVKGRSSERTIAIMVATLVDVRRVVSEMSPVAVHLAENFWPGPLTLILPAAPGLPRQLSTNCAVGVRIPNSAFLLNLLKQTGPLAVTSANRSGQPLPISAGEVLFQLKGLVHLVIDGGHLPNRKPSTIVDCTGSEPIILRDGPITLDQLKAVSS